MRVTDQNLRKSIGGPPLAPPSGQVVPTLPASASAELDIDLLDTLQRRWVLTAIILCVCMTVGFAFIHFVMKATYRAETTIYVSPDLLKSDSVQVNDVSYVTLINHEILSVNHYDTLSSAIRILGARGYPWKQAGETEQASIERLRRTVDVERIPESYEISIAASGPEPAKLALIANAVGEAYLDRVSSETGADRSGQLAVLIGHKSELEKELSAKLDEAAELSGNLQVVDLDKVQTFPDDAVHARMRVGLAAAHEKRIEAEQQLAANEKSNASAEAEQIVLNDAATRAMTGNLMARQFDLRSHIQTMLPGNPLRKPAETELSNISRQLQTVHTEMVHTTETELMDKLKSDADQSKRLEVALSKDVVDHAAEMEKSSRELHEAQALNTDIERLRSTLGKVDQSIDALKLQVQMPKLLRVFSQAQPPVLPVKSQKRKAMLALLGLALFLSLSVPVTLDALDPHVYTPSSVERILGFPPVGMTIEANPGLSDFAEEHLRRIAAGIQRSVARGARTVVLAPLKFGNPDGLAREIARVLTERGVSNLIVHANRQRPIQNPHGRDGCVSNSMSLEPYRSILKNSEDDCDVILICSSSLLLTSEAEMLATEGDVTLMFVQAGKSTRKDVERAARLLERLRAPEVGAILGHVKVERAGRLVKRELKDFKALQLMAKLPDVRFNY
jgi:capsular polysaccharide biosynthesis protein